MSIFGEAALWVIAVQLTVIATILNDIARNLK